MWQLVINGPGYFDTKYDLPEGTTHVGRADENDIVLSGDLVSRKHSRFHVTGGTLVFEDLGSRNGSRLNGDKVTGSSPMKAGDVVAVGENSLVVRQPSTAETAATEMVDAGGGGAVRRFGRGVDVSHAVLMARDIQDSIVRRVLDNSLPFEASSEPPIPTRVQRKRASDTDESEPHTAEVRLQSDGPSYPVAVHSLAMLFRIAERLATAPSLQAFLDDTTDTVMKRVGASTGVVLVRHATGALVPAAVRHAKKLQQGEVPVSDAIVEAALSQGQAIAVADVRDDARFADRESVVLYGIDQVLCVPLGQQAPFDGVLYLNRTQVSDEPIEALLDVCTALAQLLQTAIHKFSVRQGPADRVRSALERFHGPEVVERRLGELGKQRPGHLEERQATVLFAELAGFAEYAQHATPHEVAELLSEFTRVATPLVFSFEGTLERFTGEGLSTVFGAPYSKGDDAIRAVRSAMALKAEWERAMQKRAPEHRLQLRAGLTTGKVLTGLVGSELRLDYALVGETVQLAAWLCGTANAGQVLITGKTLAAVGARFDVTPLGERPLLGSRLRTAVFEVLDEDDDSGTLSGVR